MAQQWAVKAEEKFDMECTYEEAALQDTLCFVRPGMKGTLNVHPNAFDFHAQLGFLASAFKERIQAELEQQLDAMLASFGAPGETDGGPPPTDPTDKQAGKLALQRPKSAPVARKSATAKLGKTSSGSTAAESAASSTNAAARKSSGSAPKSRANRTK